MEPAGPKRLFLVVVLFQVAIFVVSLPGFGIETRKPSDYSAWAGPIFLVLTILVIALGLAALVLLRRRPSTALGLGLGQGIAALATNLLDISHVGGPPPPTGPLALGILSIVVALVTIVVAWTLRGRRLETPGRPPEVSG